MCFYIVMVSVAANLFTNPQPRINDHKQLLFLFNLNNICKTTGFIGLTQSPKQAEKNTLYRVGSFLEHLIFHFEQQEFR